MVIQIESEMPHSSVIKKKIPLLSGSTVQKVIVAWTIKSKQNAETENNYTYVRNFLVPCGISVYHVYGNIVMFSGLFDLAGFAYGEVVSECTRVLK